MHILLAHDFLYLLGILAGIWPCGTVTLAEELYLAESKSQVYGIVHSFLHNNLQATSRISELVTLVRMSNCISLHYLLIKVIASMATYSVISMNVYTHMGQF